MATLRIFTKNFTNYTLKYLFHIILPNTQFFLPCYNFPSLSDLWPLSHFERSSFDLFERKNNMDFPKWSRAPNFFVCFDSIFFIASYWIDFAFRTNIFSPWKSAGNSPARKCGTQGQRRRKLVCASGCSVPIVMRLASTFICMFLLFYCRQLHNLYQHLSIVSPTVPTDLKIF